MKTINPKILCKMIGDDIDDAIKDIRKLKSSGYPNDVIVESLLRNYKVPTVMLALNEINNMEAV